MLKIRLMLVFLICLIAGFLTQFTGSDYAIAKNRSIEVTVKSGIQTKIHRRLSWEKDCSFSPSTVDVLVKPKHGEIIARIEGGFIIRNTRRGRAKKCYGRKIKGLQIYYKSNRRYRGSDRLKLRVKHPRFSPRYVTIRINVQ